MSNINNAAAIDINAPEWDDYFDACADLSPDDDGDDDIPDMETWEPKELSPDDHELGLGTLTPPENLCQRSIYHPAILNHFCHITGGELVARTDAKTPETRKFSFVSEKTGHAYIGHFYRGADIVGTVKINTDDDFHNEIGGEKFLKSLEDILNGNDNDPLLRIYRPSDFGFFFIKEEDGFKVGRWIEDVVACKVWGFHIRDWRINENILLKAVTRALNRAGLNELDEEERPAPTRRRFLRKTTGADLN